jgi:UDP-N-acetylmuramoyl-tripeptide--D-alanyl-D-alanine ligase
LLSSEKYVNVLVQSKDISYKLYSNLTGDYNFENILAAACIGNYFGIEPLKIQSAISQYIPENNRSQLLTQGTNEIILDAYNANPSSMLVALENFIQLDRSNKCIIIGDMYELGDESISEHKTIVDFLKSKSNFECHFVGKDFFANTVQKDNFYFYVSFEDLANYLSSVKLKHTTLLIKGSRGMALERTLDYL